MEESYPYNKIEKILASAVADKDILSPEEEKILEEWISESPDNEALFLKLQSAEFGENVIKTLAHCDREANWKRIEKFLFRRSKSITVRRLRYAAACVLLATVAAGLWLSTGNDYEPITTIPKGKTQAYLIDKWGTSTALGGKDTLMVDRSAIINADIDKVVFSSRHTAGSEVSFQTIVVPRGGMYDLVLSDGSKVRLNSDSKLYFPDKFEGREREVTLIGEGFFEVAEDKARPFIVKAGVMKVRVLGTKFNVSAYGDDAFVSSTLKEGAIEVVVDDNGQKQLLSPGKQIVLENETKAVWVGEVDIENATAWQNGELFFNEMKLETILKVLARWYNVEFTYAESMTGEKQTFVGRADRSEDLKTILDRISSIGGPLFKIKKKHIEVYP